MDKFTKKGAAAAQETTAAQQPPVDNFNYETIENEMYAPDTELTIFGAEMMQIKGRLEKYLHENTQPVFGPDNQPIGHFMQPHARPIADLYGLVYRTLHRRFFEEGKTMDFDTYKSKMQTLAMEAEEKEVAEAAAE
jgi:hypothetical protein|tara:strand:- start:9152 stop:9559 length:408 start_codon:yes stop_codon:yes gene_type:complete